MKPSFHSLIFAKLEGSKILYSNFWFAAPEGPPEKVHCVSLTSTTIQVSWHPPQAHVRNGIIKGYKVLHAPRPGQIPTPAYGTGGAPKTTRLSTVTTVLDNLQKFTNYSIQVLAFTQGGDGKYSFPVSCITLTDGKLPINFNLATRIVGGNGKIPVWLRVGVLICFLDSPFFISLLVVFHPFLVAF